MKTPEPTRLRDLKTGVRDLIMLDPRIIKIEPGHNPRDYSLSENREHLDELKASIRENGTMMPLAVRWEASSKEAILVDGECRLRANLELISEGVEILSVPTFQVSATDEAQRLLLALTANTGKPLSKWEVGSAFKKFVAYGWEPAQIASKIGYSVRYVNEALELSDAPQEVKSLLSQQAVTPSLALAHIRKSGSGATLTLKSAVDAAKPNAKGKKVAKREKKAEKVFKLTEKEIAHVVDALKLGAIQPNDNCSKLCEGALQTLREKGVAA